VADPDYPRLRHATHLTVYESLQRSGSFSGENHQKVAWFPGFLFPAHGGMVGRCGVTLRPSALLSPWVGGPFAPDAVTTDIFFWTLSVGGQKRLAPKAPLFYYYLSPNIFSIPGHSTDLRSLFCVILILL
jgi:hypothetical protein